MLEFLPELQELELVRSQLGLFPMPPDFSRLDCLEVLVFRGTDIWRFPVVPESLRRLDVSDSPSLKYRIDLDDTLPGLESFSISANPGIDNEELLGILSTASQKLSLRHLDVGMCPRIDADSLEWLLDAGHGDNLESLSLHGNQKFGDQVTRELGRMTNLKRLDIGNTKISGVGVSNLIHRRNSKLEWLGLDYCPNVGRDAIDMAVAEGLQVSHKSEQLKGGRKVRY
jgi:Leucine-rich repeat (LRR) protein